MNNLYKNIDPDLNITKAQVNRLVNAATTTTETPTNNFIDGSQKNETPREGNKRQRFAKRVFAGDDDMFAYINWGQKDSMDAGDPPGGHDGRGDPTTFNGYGLLNGFGGDDIINGLDGWNRVCTEEE